MRLLSAIRKSKWPAQPKLYALVLMALTTGARKGELLQLRGRDLDLEQGVARVNHTKNLDRKTLALTPPVVAALRSLPQ